MRRALDLIASVATIVASGAVLWMVVTSRTDVGSPASPTSPVADVQKRQLTLSMSDAQGTRPPGAKIAVVEFSDFHCPFCARHAKDTLPLIKRKFVDSNAVAYLFVNFPLEDIHPQALDAGAEAMCAGDQGKFWPAHHLLFRLDGPRPLAANGLVGNLAMDDNEFRRCLAMAPERIRRGAAIARNAGVNSTPTFLLGDLDASGSLTVRKQIAGAVPYATFSDAIEELIAERH